MAAERFEVVVGVFVKKDDRYLIVKRAPGVKHFPNMWVPPGGHLELDDFQRRPMDSCHAWMDPLKVTINRELFEETGIQAGTAKYITNRAFFNSKGAVVVFSFVAPYVSGLVSLKLDEVCDFAWVTLEEARNYSMIDGVLAELEMAVNAEATARIPQLTDGWWQ